MAPINSSKFINFFDIMPVILPYLSEWSMQRGSVTFDLTEEFGIKLSPWEIRVVACLGIYPGISIREIATTMQMQRPKASRAAARLELLNVVEKHANIDDARLITMTLSEKGMAIFDQVKRRGVAMHNNMLRNLSDEEQIQLLSLLRKLMDTAKSEKETLERGELPFDIKAAIKEIA